MNAVSELEPESLRALFWRDEISEAMWWLHHDGLAPKVDAELLDRFLWVDVRVDAERLDSLVDAGLLRRTSEGLYELTEAGAEHGGRLFMDDFPDIWTAAPDSGACACGCCGGESERAPGAEAVVSACACGCCGGEPERAPAEPLVSAGACGCCGGDGRG